MAVPENTLPDLNANIDAIQNNKIEIDGLPQKANDSYGELVKWIRIGGHISSGLNPFAHWGVEELVDEMWENRDKVTESLKRIIDKLAELIKGIGVPITFINFADDWRNIAGEFTHAGNAFGATSLKSDWQGIAADRYRDMRDIQEKAFTAMPKLCEQVALSLEQVAVDTLDLYIAIAKNTLDLVHNTKQALADIAEKGPLAILEAGNLVEVVQGLETFIFDNVTKVAETAQKQMIEGNRIAQATSVQDGIPNNKWPPAVTNRVVDNGVVVNPGEEYSDGTVTDGNNKWSVKTDVVTQ
ncbi:hypothetical protein [Nocardia cyriacigeorgica]|uniref:Uncharacterized protein n=1 Tax=Nocardia cyriacigeorgica (strain GUH-2) TaxID=1127134 RepID=H6R6A4_NOCCG|nr:hypothetical protein [Nocardia cyriacigeorgica]BDU03788.1 hypothetical protein FMUBM48_00510 [Nocardia cyriacigeorgica]CCF60877.1 conserved putative protein of unknown function [Nocardia cyriacigeorgica GUH-2]